MKEDLRVPGEVFFLREIDLLSLSKLAAIFQFRRAPQSAVTGRWTRYLRVCRKRNTTSRNCGDQTYPQTRTQDYHR